MYITIMRLWCLTPLFILVHSFSINSQSTDTTDNSTIVITRASPPSLNFTNNLTTDARPTPTLLKGLDSTIHGSNSLSSTKTTTIEVDNGETSTKNFVPSIRTNRVRADTTNTIRTTVSNGANTTSYASITSEPPTTTITAEPCSSTSLYGINVYNRSSNNFSAIITYNCGFVNWNSSSIIYNRSVANCSVTDNTSPGARNNTVTVICDSIQNQAGRNWSFNIWRNSSYGSAHINDTFIVTLEPLPLATLSNENITVDDNLLSASIYVPNCITISDPKYLVVRCNDTDQSNNTRSENCTYTCSDLQPGCVYNPSLVRLSIPKNDNPNVPFPEDYRNLTTYKTKLDKVKNLTFTGNLTENETAIINFIRPSGFYDGIRVDCSPTDLRCWNNSLNLTNYIGNCSSCNTVSIQKITHGVYYQCQAFTIKVDFDNAESNLTSITTNLPSVLYDGVHSFDTSLINFTIIPTSDFSNIVSNCTASGPQSSVCHELFKQHDRCALTLNIKGTLGCIYECSFTAVKENYISAPSHITYLTLNPPQPTIVGNGTGSRWINISWEIPEIAYIKSFEIIINGFVRNISKSSTLVNETKFSCNYTDNDITPYRSYQIRIRLSSNVETYSQNIYVKTLQEAPEEPDLIDVEKKIIPQSDNEKSTSTQYVIDIDPSLFSDEYGPLEKYLIYVRQNQSNTISQIEFNGTYADAWDNASVDYLAVVLPVNNLRNYLRNSEDNITLLLGNETGCLDDSLTYYTSCNGPLKPSTEYRLLVAGCTTVGCTFVVSKVFQTLTPVSPIPPDSSKAWVVIFPLLAIIIVAAILGTWKRKRLKQFIDEKVKKVKKSSENDRSQSITLPIRYHIEPKRPKLISKYIDMKTEDEKAIFNEYQELDTASLPVRQSDCESNYGIYDRYGNIHARGPWIGTAVKITGDERDHDYINANKIRGLYSDTQYIACQGPLESTCGDFWEMIVQQKVSKIVMLTRTVETNPHNHSQKLSKCYQYFPKDKGQPLRISIGTVEVEDTFNQMNGELEIRHLRVKADDKEYCVIHYYFTGWPDFGIVDKGKLLELIEVVTKPGGNFVPTGNEALLIPMVVHCSAGVGRTGTFIAVDIIRQLINLDKDLPTMKLDVMGIVFQLRQDRGKMVQTKDQYMLVNRCVEEHLRRAGLLEKAIPQSSIYENYDNEASVTSAGHGMSFRNGIKKERSSASTTDGSTDLSSVIIQAKKSGPGSNDLCDENDEINFTPPRSSRTAKKSQSQNN